MEKIIKMTPAYDRRDIKPDKHYGVHGVDIHFIVKDSNKAVDFIVFTNWHLPHVLEELLSKNKDYDNLKPVPASIGYHSPHPMYENQFSIKKCDIIKQECFYGASILNAKRYFDILVSEGLDSLWNALEQYFEEIFNA